MSQSSQFWKTIGTLKTLKAKWQQDQLTLSTQLITNVIRPNCPIQIKVISDTCRILTFFWMTLDVTSAKLPSYYAKLRKNCLQTRSSWLQNLWLKQGSSICRISNLIKRICTSVKIATNLNTTSNSFSNLIRWQLIKSKKCNKTVQIRVCWIKMQFCKSKR